MKTLLTIVFLFIMFTIEMNADAYDTATDAYGNEITNQFGDAYEVTPMNSLADPYTGQLVDRDQDRYTNGFQYDGDIYDSRTGLGIDE